MSNTDKLTNANEFFNAILKEKLGTKKKKEYLADVDNIHIEKFPTGSLKLDIELLGGWPKGTAIEILGPSGGGKAQPLYSKILTPTGFIEMRDIKVGDSVCSPDGTVTQVIGVFPQGEKDIYELTFDDGSKTRACGEHLWEVFSKSSNTPDIMTTTDILKQGVKISDGWGNKFKIRRNKAVEFSKKSNLPLDPYLLGFLLGDGCLQKTSVRFSTADKEIIEYVEKILEVIDEELTVKKVGNKIESYDYSIVKKNRDAKNKNNKVLDVLRFLGLSEKRSHEKFIPDVYKLSTKEDRLALLQGLMDSDGCASTERGALSFSTVSPKLKEDFTFLAKSLGFRCVWSERLGRYKTATGARKDGRLAYKAGLIQQDFDYIPFRLKRKVNNYIKNYSKSWYEFNFITSIEKVGKDLCQCIKVAHRDSLYITDDFIVTHNTTLTAEGVAQHQKKYPKEVILWLDLEGVFDKVYFENVGVDTNPDRFILAQPVKGEEAFEIMRAFCENFEGGVIVVDSVAMLLPTKEAEADFEDAQMGMHARLMSKGLRNVLPLARDKGITQFYINQERTNIGNSYGDPSVGTGGKALPYYTRTRIKVGRQNSKGEAGNSIGVSYKTIKANFGRENVVVDAKVIFGVGIDYVTDLIDLGVQFGVIQKGGSWYSYKDSKIGQGAEVVKKMLADNPEMFEEIENDVKEKLQGHIDSLKLKRKQKTDIEDED